MSTSMAATGCSVAPSLQQARPQAVGQTQRQDAWWLEPVLTVLALLAFSAYAFWRAANGNDYTWGPYLSPFFSPNLKELFPGLLDGLPFSWAFVILWIPLGFRGTCYFYRRAYYRAFFWSPPACAVGGAKTGILGKYIGERQWPFLFQNAHRFFFYLAALLAIGHWFHAVQSMQFDGGFGMGVGSLILLTDAVLLTLYTFSCHSWRHLLGGKLDCFSCDKASQVRHKAWHRQSLLNEKHMFFAWASLFTVGLADFYIWLLASGRIQETCLIGQCLP